MAPPLDDIKIKKQPKLNITRRIRPPIPHFQGERFIVSQKLAIVFIRLPL
jgi:hypothetical protein